MAGEDHTARDGVGRQQTTKARLWVVSELYYPEQTGTGYFITRIGEGLAEDYDVRVVCGQPSYSERGMKAPAREERNGTRIHRLWATKFDKDRLFLRTINAVTLTVAVLFFCLLRFRRGDRVLAVTNPPTVPIVVGLAARLHRCRTILLVHDVYPELLAAAGMLKPDSLRYRVLNRLFFRTYRFFDRIVVIGRDMAELISTKMGGDDARIDIIPNWGDADEIRPDPSARNAFRRAHGLDGKFVVQFSGNIGRTHDVELVLEAARQLRGDPRILFLFVSSGGRSARAADAARDGGNVHVLPRQPRDKLGAMLTASDANVIPFVKGMFGLSVPSRMYNIMAAGVPIIAVSGPRSELALTVSEAGSGWVLPESDPAALAALITRLATAEGEKERRERGRLGREAVLNHYTLPIILESFRSVMRKA